MEITGLHLQGSVYVVTHGTKYSGSDPGMTADGYSQVRALTRLIPTTIPCCLIGTGKRHHDVATALKMTSDRCSRKFSSIVGRPDSLEGHHIILASNLEVPQDEYDTTGLKDASILLLNSLQPDTVICAGRPFLEYLGVPDVASAAVYRIDPNGTVTKISD